ncbi:MAG: PTS sugar transporter subunit IIA [Verrucomicrobiia bacterium]
MQFTIKDLARIFKTTERTVAAWVRKGELKAHRDGDFYSFNREEVLEWAFLRKMQVPDELLNDSDSTENHNHLLSESIKAGGIFYGIKGKTKSEVLKNIIEKMRLPEDADRNYLLKMVLAREKLSSTAIGDGFAIPHLRSPIVININKPQTTLCFTENPVDFGAIDGVPVTTIFMILSPSVRKHLRILSKLSYFLKNENVKIFLHQSPPEKEIFKMIEEFENFLDNQKKN